MPERGPLSAHEAFDLMSAFQQGLDDEKQSMVKIDLPIVPRIENNSSFWDGFIPSHQISSKNVLQLFFGADFLCVEIAERESEPQQGRKPSASISVDHNGCGHVRIKTTRNDKPKDHPLPQWM